MKNLSKKSVGRSGPTSQWNSPDVSVRVSDEFYVSLINCLIESLFWSDCLRLETLHDLDRVMGSYERLAIWSRDHEELDVYFRANQVVSFFRKFEHPLFDQQATEIAFTKWLSVEAECKEMNEKCKEIFLHPLTHKQSELQTVIDSLKGDIEALIGEVPPDLDEVAGFMRFGPGATVSHSRNEGAVCFKLQNHSAYCGMEQEVEWLVENTGLFAECILPGPGEFSLDFGQLADQSPKVQFVQSAKLDFVPKSTTEKRTIEIGPSLAVLFQQAYDGFLRRRLLTWGIDLQNQEPNRELAYQGSVAGDKPNSPCTLDLSAASDRISYGVFALLFPKSWVRTLIRYRAKEVLYKGESHILEKFASMGNSLTFSLQTLIFSAVVRSVLRERGGEGSRWRVYGDDIIVPHRLVHWVVYKLQILGFKLNLKKSFFHGFFRESCGADYLRGTNVRPLYIKKPFTSVAELYKVLNLVQITAARAPIPASCFMPVYKMVLRLVPRKLRLFGDTRHALDSCVWAPYWFGDKILRRRTSDECMPVKLAYFCCLFNGYMVDKDTLEGVPPHSLPSYPGGSSYVIRRAPPRGRVVRDVKPEELPFNPFLLG